MKSILVMVLNQWIWSMTWGIYHAPLTMMSMFFLFFFFEGRKFVSSLLLSFTANVASLVCINGILGFIIWMSGTDGGVPGQMFALTPGYASLILAIMYCIFQFMY